MFVHVNRRTILALFGSTILAGCSSSSESTVPPEPNTTTVEVLTRNCVGSGDNAATVTFSSDNSQVSINERISVPRTDQILYVDTRNGVGFENRSDDAMEIRIHYLPPDRNSNVDGADCAGTIDYQADVEFSPAPSSVIIRHVTEQNGDAVLETITTAEPS